MEERVLRLETRSLPLTYTNSFVAVQDHQARLVWLVAGTMEVDAWGVDEAGEAQASGSHDVPPLQTAGSAEPKCALCGKSPGKDSVARQEHTVREDTDSSLFGQRQHVVGNCSAEAW